MCKNINSKKKKAQPENFAAEKKTKLSTTAVTKRVEKLPSSSRSKSTSVASTSSSCLTSTNANLDSKDGWLTASSTSKRQVEQHKTREINSMINERKQILQALKKDAKMEGAHKKALPKQVVLSTGETLHFVKVNKKEIPFLEVPWIIPNEVLDAIEAGRSPKKLKVVSTEEGLATSNVTPYGPGGKYLAGLLAELSADSNADQNQFASHLSQHAAEDSSSIGNEKALAVVDVAEKEDEQEISSNAGEITSVETSIVDNSKDDNCNNKEEDVAPSSALPICSARIENYGSLAQDESNDNADGHDDAEEEEEEDVVWTYMQDINEALEGWDVDEFATEEADFDFQSIFIQPTE
ncbi:unnamed protein product [Allacma fusca]|uniref:Uncharacterized protein n=1 Tax=Allacma fusca TaxID=39272 RepID=A0A8J2JJV2_9HEXA|nr:unnamed protein product [Allacma fusca]